MHFLGIIGKIRKRIIRLYARPVEVFVFHAVSKEFDERRNKKVDWSQIEDFERRILWLKERYTFISLEEAYKKLRSGGPRFRRYAVMTCDDGYASVLDVLPFMEEEQIPVTLFINPKYLDGVSYREGYVEDPKYITYDQLWALTSPLVTVGMHGYEHDDATKMSTEEFEVSVEKCEEMLQSHPRYIPYFAYTWGRYTDCTQRLLKRKGIVPLLVSGETNYCYEGYLDRRPIDSIYWDKIKNELTCTR